jgi:hypothetical protein
MRSTRGLISKKPQGIWRIIARQPRRKPAVETQTLAKLERTAAFLLGHGSQNGHKTI